MSQHNPAIAAPLALLSGKRSPKRRSGAKRLRKLRDPAAGPALLQALQQEVRDSRTWETQYQMIMALGECGYRPALPYLQTLAAQPFEATMVYVALGDAIVRLGRVYADDPQPVLALMRTGNDMLIDGAFRAVAMLHLKLDADAVEQIVGFVASRSLQDGLRFWVAAAAAGWSGPSVAAFLEACATGPRQDVQRAALASQQGKYLQWNPL